MKLFKKIIKYLIIGIVILIVLDFIYLYVVWKHYGYKDSSLKVKPELFVLFDTESNGKFIEKDTYKNRNDDYIIIGTYSDKYDVIIFKSDTKLDFSKIKILSNHLENIKDNNVRMYSEFNDELLSTIEMSVKTFMPEFDKIIINAIDTSLIRLVHKGDNYSLFEIYSDQISIGNKKNSQNIVMTMHKEKNHESELLIYSSGNELYIIMLNKKR